MHLAVVARILEATTQEKPAAATHWSVRTLAQHLGINRSVVHRVWRSHNLQRHRTKTFKLSNDPEFERKLHDIVGLYLNRDRCIHRRVRVTGRIDVVDLAELRV
jgi:hypothetical protein